MGNKIVNSRELATSQVSFVATSIKQEGVCLGSSVACWKASNVLFLDLVDSYTLKLFIRVCVYVLLTFQYVCYISHKKLFF